MLKTGKILALLILLVIYMILVVKGSAFLVFEDSDVSFTAVKIENISKN